MKKPKRMIASMLLALLCFLGVTEGEDKPGAPATEKPTVADASEKVLTDKGLTKDAHKFLLDEAAAIEKYKAAKLLLEDYQKAMGRLAVILQYDEGIGNMQMQSQGMQQDINMLQSQINSASNTGFGRMRTMVNAQLAPMRAQQTQAQNQLTQLNAQIKTMQGQGPKPADRQLVPAEVERTRQAYVDCVRELEVVVAPLLAKYHQLALDKTVITALSDLKHLTKLNYKLGPSDQVHAAAAMIREVKRVTATPKHTTKSTPKKKTPHKVQTPSSTPGG